MVVNLIKCLICNEEIKNNSICNQCDNSNLAVFEKNKILYKGKKYNRRTWYLFLTSYTKIGKEEIIAKHTRENISYAYLYDIFIGNSQKYTFLGLLLPSIVFFVIAWINIIVGSIILNNNDFIVDGSVYNMKYFFYFLGVLYFLFFVITFYLWAIKKQKCYLAKVRGQTRYVHITKEKYCEIIKTFETLKNKDE